MLIFLLLGTVYCTALAKMGYFQSWIDYSKLRHNFLESPPLVEQCMEDNFSNGSESEEVAD